MLNKAILMGRLVADPELRHTQSSIPVTSFTIAVSRTYAKQGEQRQSDFVDIIAWRQTAEFVTKHFSKGSQIVVVGSIQTRTYEDKQGNKRKAVEVLAEEVHFGEGKKDSQPPIASSDGFTPISSDEDLPF